MNFISVIMVVVLGVIILLCVVSFAKRLTGRRSCCGTSLRSAASRKRIDKPIGRLVLHIDGMKCANCCQKVLKSLNALDGVSAKVSLAKGTAFVTLGSEVSEDALRRALEAEGFRLRKIEKVGMDRF